ncbi:hypothetical protein BXZ70DRAFT_570443 [Cristinia sonorae]|uniref:F-box domain-containing protein n=1 Tax=Cristinia sonorae TaxID=1940300 RepID=A0A8K0UGH5_9AGAR|nr:hypothetical protein BXZ70DRAFT_570443 [Cristinia sonorae]
MEVIACARCSPSLSELVHQLLSTDIPTGSSSADATSFVQHIDSAVLQCQRIIQGYQQIIRSLYARRNTRIHIHHLADEILEDIFWKTVDWDQGSMNVVPMSQVCRRWRDIALQSPRLWSVIAVTNQVKTNFLRNFIESRSQSLPLSLLLSDDVSFPGRECFRDFQDLHSDTHSNPRRHSRDKFGLCVYSVWRRFMEAFPRARHIDLHFNSPLAASTVSPRLPEVHLPQLEYLAIQVVNPRLRGGHGPIYISLSTFVGGLPALRDLSLTLGYLEALRFPELLHVLRTSPNLETLKLTGVADSSYLRDNKYTPIALPNVKYFHFTDYIWKLVFLVEKLLTPGIQRCCLQGTHSLSIDGAKHIVRLLWCLSKLVRVLEPLSHQSPQFCARFDLNPSGPFSYSETFRFWGYSEGLDGVRFQISNVLAKSEPLIEVKFELSHEPSHSIWQMPPDASWQDCLRGVIVLELCGHRVSAVLDELRYLTKLSIFMPCLEEIVFRNSNLETIQNSWLLPWSDSSETEIAAVSDHSLSLPNLKSIRFEDVSLSSSSDVASTTTSNEAVIDVVRDMLRNCARKYAQLESVHFVRCGLSSEEFISLGMGLEDRVFVTKE